MKYLVTGKIRNTGEMVTPEQFTQLINRGIILNLKAYKDLDLDDGITFKENGNGNGNGNSSRTGVAIIDANTDSEVNRVLENFPQWLKVNWNVAPLENF